ncbi:Planctomycete cytochrome C [Thalassoglobus neptunius]|uniref:Planctomycete cytochrome C n=1 Tax=Thalassoglobus neptunius TaxID=1938619 RepID=A0A5C5X7V0_9PLAN|nr:DUF1549 domain-containing protein [Thalassoglobus neptunius]TWT59126.1 Planctomycete cytochrome C [Thalassoglobus neptunius]
MIICEFSPKSFRALDKMCLIFVLSLTGAVATAAEPSTSKEIAVQTELNSKTMEFFESRVRPLLVEHCHECHSGKVSKGGLKLDSISEILSGGESGPAVIPHKADESLLIEAIRYESYEMPPAGQLSEKEIDVLVKWVELGAPWPGGDRTVRPASSADKITDEDRQFWSFQPLRDPTVPQVEPEHWPRNAVDRFLLRKMNENGLSPSDEAEPLTLVRRLYFDLTGLPPTPEQVDEFLADTSPEAYERLVDDLLDSPRYGEHWAQFWLDLVRYAESDGYRKDDYRPNAWQYRDYVIQAFNSDKPFDQFVREQIAGDEIAPNDPEAIAATGFLRCGIYEYNQRDVRTQWQDMLNDITDTVGDTFLGVGMGCARCHDHKFDPILQKDYFRLQAFFANISLDDEKVLASPDEIVRYEEQLEQWETATESIRQQIDQLKAPKLKELERKMVMMFPEDIQEIYYRPAEKRSSLDDQLRHLVFLQVLDRYKTLPTTFKGEEKKKWDALQKELAEFDDLKPQPLPKGRSISEFGDEAPEIFIPSKERLGEVEPGFLTIFDPESANIAELNLPEPTTGRRTTLANWLTKENHPLTTRVIVNRIWKQHFGAGIVNSPSDFGHLGETPTHPELLDWLATRFVEKGWSLKWLHREIVHSAAYRQSSLTSNKEAELIDPENRFLWKFNVRRLSAEQIRDAQLSVAGTLNLKSGGPPASIDSDRRTIFNKVIRNKMDPLLALFDFPDRITSSPSRNITTSPSQSLLLINGEQTLGHAQDFANRLVKSNDRSLESQIRDAYLTALQRPPTEQELNRTLRFLEESQESSPVAEEVARAKTNTQVLEVNESPLASPVQTLDSKDLPRNQFTVSATLLLRSIYPDASVRTIASHWNSDSKSPGWSLGVTSTKSSHQPRHLILQLIGKNSSGKRTYEIVRSGIHLELNRPYFVSVSVDLENPTADGITFVVRNLITNEQTVTHADHRVVQAETNRLPFVVGGRVRQNRHRWDGWIDDLHLYRTALSEEEILTPEAILDANIDADQIVGQWDFNGGNTALIDRVHNRELNVESFSNAPPSQLVDFCHVLLNSNEFIYID